MDGDRGGESCDGEDGEAPPPPSWHTPGLPAWYSGDGEGQGGGGGEVGERTTQSRPSRPRGRRGGGGEDGASGTSHIYQ